MSESSDDVIEFRYVEDAPFNPTMVAVVRSRVVCVLSWRTDDAGRHVVGTVWIKKSLRRQGLATALMGELSLLVPDLQHSSDRTRHADAWSATTGFPRPESHKVSRLTIKEMNEEGQSLASQIERLIFIDNHP